LNTELTSVSQANIVGSGKGDKPGPNEPAPGSNRAKGASTNKDGSQIAEGAPPTPAPGQINEATQSSSSSTTNNGQNGKSGKDSESKQDSTSKKKEKKGLRKLFPF